jgi:hypothetical protein
MHKTARGVAGARARRQLAVLALVAVGASEAAAQAVGAAPSPWRWSGFATLGLTYHGNESAGAIASFAQRSPANDGVSGNLDTVGGLQLDLRLLDSTTATAQAVVRAGEDFQPRLRMAYLRQQIGGDAAVRVGRFRSPLYLDSDVSEIGFAYLPMRPAMPVYGVAANYVPHIDGADVQWRHSFGPAGVMVQAYLGRTGGKQILSNTNPRAEADFDLTGIRGLAVSVGFANVTVRASHTETERFTLRAPEIDQLNGGLAQIAGSLAAIAADPRLPGSLAAVFAAQARATQGFFNPYDNRPVYTSLGFDANVERWRLMGEVTTFDSRSATVGRYQGGQLTLGYSWGPFTPYVGISRNTRDAGSLDTRALVPTGLNPALDGAIDQLKGALDQAAQFADLSSRSSSIGVRWDARDNVAVKLQWDQIRTPSVTVPGVLSVPRLPFDNRVNLFGATLNVIF